MKIWESVNDILEIVIDIFQKGLVIYMENRIHNYFIMTFRVFLENVNIRNIQWNFV